MSPLPRKKANGHRQVGEVFRVSVTCPPQERQREPNILRAVRRGQRNSPLMIMSREDCVCLSRSSLLCNAMVLFDVITYYSRLPVYHLVYMYVYIVQQYRMKQSHTHIMCTSVQQSMT